MANAVIAVLLAALVAWAAWRTARRAKRGGGCCGEREAAPGDAVRSAGYVVLP